MSGEDNDYDSDDRLGSRLDYLRIAIACAAVAAALVLYCAIFRMG